MQFFTILLSFFNIGHFPSMTKTPEALPQEFLFNGHTSRYLAFQLYICELTDRKAYIGQFKSGLEAF